MVMLIGGQKSLPTLLDYRYDPAGRLIEVKRNSVIIAGYGYDANDNRTQVNGVTVAQYDDQDRLTGLQWHNLQLHGQRRTPK